MQQVVSLVLIALASACIASRVHFDALASTPEGAVALSSAEDRHFRGLLEDSADHLAFVTCVSTQTKRVLSSCGTNKSGVPRDSLTRLLRTCMTSDSLSASDRPVRFLITNSSYMTVIKDITSVYQSMTGVPIKLVTPLFNEIDKLRAPSLAKPADVNTTHEVWFLSPSTIGDGMATGAFKDLTDLVVLDKRLDWYSIFPLVRQSSLLYQSRVVGLPLSAYVMTMFHRVDVFARYNMTVPRTWRELLTFIRNYNGTDDMYGYCGTWYGCSSSGQFLPRMVAGTYIQTMGLSHGSAIDPETMLPLYDTAAMNETFNILRELYALTPQESRFPTDCSPQKHPFYTGKCLITIDAPSNFKFMSHSAQASIAAAVQGNMGTSQIPGSDLVLDRATNTLVPCTPERCPYAVKYTNDDGSTLLVNVAPTYAASILALNEKMPPDLSFFAFSMLSYIASSEVRRPMIFDPSIDVFPVQKQSLSAWIAAGYNAADIERWIAQHEAGINHPNLNVNLRSQGGPRMNRLNLNICTNITNTTMTNAEIMAAAQSQAVALFNSLYKGNMTAFKLDYWSSLNRDVRSILAASTPSSPQQALSQYVSEDRADSLTTGGIVGVVIGSVGFVALLLTLIIRYHMKRRARTEQLEHPAVGPLSTLLITDIENSTSLWEELAAEVMDTAVKLHNACIRHLAAEHQGYESAWEGDSFIIAFHNPQKAMEFAISMQLAMLNVAWPPAVLASKYGQEMWLRRIRNNTNVAESPGRPIDGSNHNNSSTSQEGAACDSPPLETLEFSVPGPSEKSMHSRDAFSTMYDTNADSLFQSGPLDTESLFGTQSNFSLPTMSASANGSALRHSSKLPTYQSLKLKRSKSKQPATAELLGTRVHRSWVACTANASGSVLCYRGLRVRVGMHCGIEDAAHVNFNAHMRRYHYTGPIRNVAAAVASAGHGGMVLLSGAALELLISTRTATKAEYNLYTTGHHELTDVPDQTVEIVQALPSSLACRLAVQQDALRSRQCVLPGVLSAPLPSHALGCTTLVFVQVLSLDSLRTWDSQHANKALTSTQLCAFEQITRWNGVLSEDGLFLSHASGPAKGKSGLMGAVSSLPPAAPGRLVVAFKEPYSALQFALHLRHALLLLDWESELLAHELCEPVGTLPDQARGPQPTDMCMLDGGADSDGGSSDHEIKLGPNSTSRPLNADREGGASLSGPSGPTTAIKMTADLLNDDTSSIASALRPPLMVCGLPAESDAASSFTKERAPAISTMSLAPDTPSPAAGQKDSNIFSKQLAKKAQKSSKTRRPLSDLCEFNTPMLRGLRTKTVVMEAAGCDVKIASQTTGRLQYVGKSVKQVTQVIKRAKAGQVLASSALVKVASDSIVP